MDTNGNWSFAGATDTGLVRKRNEDSLLVAAERGILAVADGMGGAAGGEIASRLAVRFVSRILGGDATFPPTLDGDKVRQALQRAIAGANDAIMQSALANTDLTGMGTTIVLCVLRGGLLHCAHLGDSRLYLGGDSGLERMTLDHSFVARVLDEELSDEEAAKHPRRNVITRALGFKMEEPADYASFELGGARYILLCTDGLWSLVPAPRMNEILEAAATPEEACDALVEAAKEAGGRDNITAVVGMRF